MAYTVFAWNFANGLKRCPTVDFAVKNHFPDSAKSKIAAAAAIVKFNLTATPVIIAYFRTKFGTASKSDVSVTGLPLDFTSENGSALLAIVAMFLK